MTSHTFRPRLDDVLEDRLVLSQFGLTGAVHAALAHPKPVAPGHPVLTAAVLNDVDLKINAAFARFNREYTSEVARVDRSGDETRFGNDFAASVNRLRVSLAIQAARIPGGSTDLNPVLQQRVGSLVNDLLANPTVSSTDLIRSDQSGAVGDVRMYVHDAVSKGDFSLR